MSSTVDRQAPDSAPAARGDEGTPPVLREAVIDAALEVIRERGLARTRTSHIARAAGCAEGSIYRYFSGKSELVSEVVHSRLRSIIGALADLPLRAGTSTLEANLLEAARTAFASYREGVTLLGGLFADTELLAAEREFLAAHDVGPHAAAGNLAAYLKAEQELGRVRRDADVDMAARVLLASCLGESFFRAMDADVDAADRYLGGLVDTLIAGLATSDTRAARGEPARRQRRARGEQR